MTFEQLDHLLLGTRDEVAYIADPLKLEENIRRFCDALTGVYPSSRMGYSYKTNYLPVFCRLAHSMGLYAEVVSGMEYEIARAMGIDHEQIIFNGPDKKEHELESTLLNGAIVNIDSLDELERVIAICKAFPERQFKVGLRCRYGKYKQILPSRFGLDEETGELTQAAGQLRAVKNCRLAGLHCHSSYDRSVASYEARARAMVSIADRLFESDPPDYIDLGGGFCGDLPEAIEKQVGEGPSYEEYATAIGGIFSDHYGDAGPELIVEPGVGVLADAMLYICRIAAVKEQSERTGNATQCPTSRRVGATEISKKVGPASVSHGFDVAVFIRMED